jgi:tRNA (guanine26-N2/guanine27-N2)-dimethyltransferase
MSKKKKLDNTNLDFPTETVKEGRVEVSVPKLAAFVKSPSDYAPSKAPVFYNPVMELNRDIAVLALQAYQRVVNREISVCEPLTGCGVRGIRFAVEVEGIRKVVINDINEKAFQLAVSNVHMKGLPKRILVENYDANSFLGRYGAPRRRFDCIDVDPFGSPVRYLDSAIRALRNGGFLALTATDMAPLCGVHPKACIRKYGGKPLRTEYCQEIAVRLLTGCLATTAAKNDIGIRVVFSHSTAHYIRIYAIADHGARKADESIKKMGYILHCFKCFHRETTKELLATDRSAKCSECGSKIDFAGPLWLGRIVEREFCELMEKEAKHKALRHGEELRRILALTKDEADAPITYYVLDKLCSRLALPALPVKRLFKDLKDSFQASLTHYNTKGIRTNASAATMKELLQNSCKVLFSDKS